MRNNHIVILTGNDNFFGQTRRPWVSMSVDKIQNILENDGFTVERCTFHEIVNRQEKIRDSIIFYTFSQKRNIREYIKDLIYYLDDGTNLVIPSYELLLCHEDKGFQELYKKKINLHSLKAYYLSNRQELPYYQIAYPIVIKSVEGSNGKRVYLARDEQELIQAIDKFESIKFIDRLDLIRRKYFRKKKHYKEYPDYSNRKDYEKYKDYVKREKNFILQEFVPGLEFDYRVLVLYDKYYVTKRHTRTNDFRASGAKKFDFDYEFDPDLLNFARQVYEKFDTPFLSIDIGIYDNNYFLFEFQVLHFGINVFVKNSGYYTFENNNWKFTECPPDFEKEMTEALIKYIRVRC